MKQNLVFAGIAAIVLLLAPLPVNAQLPEAVGQWRLQSTVVLRPQYPPNTDATRLEGFGVKKPVWAVYARGRDAVTVLLAELESRERAFGLFAAASPARRHGIVGDAFALDRGVHHVNYGPFYLYFRASGRMARIPEELVNAVMRVLFDKADCFGSDIPLNIGDRILGSEMYFPPDVRAWSDFTLPALEPVESIIRGRAAWLARYSPRGSTLTRWLIALPVRQADALKLLEAGIIERFASDGNADEDCRLASYFIDDFTVHILPGRGQLFIAVVDEDDRGGCEWARSLLAE